MNGSTVIKTNDPYLAKLSEELINSGVIQIAAKVAPDACWLDGSRCPYGYPEGTFQKRPQHVCFIGGNQDFGCRKLAEHKKELTGFSHLLIAEEAEPKLIEVFNRFGVTLSSEIATLSDEEGYTLSSLEKTILIAAAKIIEREEQNENIAPIDNKIIRRKDFEL